MTCRSGKSIFLHCFLYPLPWDSHLRMLRNTCVTTQVIKIVWWKKPIMTRNVYCFYKGYEQNIRPTSRVGAAYCRISGIGENTNVSYFPPWSVRANVRRNDRDGPRNMCFTNAIQWELRPGDMYGEWPTGLCAGDFWNVAQRLQPRLITGRHRVPVQRSSSRRPRHQFSRSRPWKRWGPWSRRVTVETHPLEPR